MNDPLGIEYVPEELCLRVAGHPRGELVCVYLYEAGFEEQTFLLRVPEDEDPEPHVETSCRWWLREYSSGEHDDWEFDWGHAHDGTSGYWVPDANGLPNEIEEITYLFTAGPPPLGASRGAERDSRDYRWAYVAPTTSSLPSEPLKRLKALHTELRRVAVRPESWGRISFPLRNDPQLVLRLTPPPRQAALLISTHADDPRPCRLRVDMDQLINWLEKEQNDGRPS